LKKRGGRVVAINKLNENEQSIECEVWDDNMGNGGGRYWI